MGSKERIVGGDPSGLLLTNQPFLRMSGMGQKDSGRLKPIASYDDLDTTSGSKRSFGVRPSIATPTRARARARVAALRIHAMAHGTVVVEARGED